MTARKMRSRRVNEEDESEEEEHELEEHEEKEHDKQELSNLDDRPIAGTRCRCSKQRKVVFCRSD